MPDTVLSAFPNNETEALALLYVQNQDLSNCTPEQIFDLYQDAYDKIRNHEKEKRIERRNAKINR